MIMLIHKHKHL